MISVRTVYNLYLVWRKLSLIKIILCIGLHNKTLCPLLTFQLGNLTILLMLETFSQLSGNAIRCLFLSFLLLLCLSGRKMAPTRQRPLSKVILGTSMKIMWEEQLVDPPTTYITSVNVVEGATYWFSNCLYNIC